MTVARGVSTTALACAMNVTRQTVMKRADKERWAFRDTGSGRLWDITSLPHEVQLKLAPELAEQNPAAKPVAVFKEVSETNRSKARLRMALIASQQQSGLSVSDFVSAYNAGMVNQPLLGMLGKVSMQTFYRWLADWKAEGMDGIVPKWGLNKATGCSLSLLEKGLLEHWYLAPEKRSAMHCWRLLAHNLPDSQASYATALRYLSGLPKPLQAFHRLGRTKFDAMFQPYIDRDPGLYRPMEQVVSDHHCFDFVVMKDGMLLRPWITTFQDYATSKILGWCPSVYPSSLSIMVSFYLMVTRFGAPELIHIDNGKDYRSKVLNGATQKMKILNEDGFETESYVHLHGAFSLLGSKVTFSEPYHGQSKGRQERTFGTFAEYFSRETGTYIGSNTVTRPEESQLFYRALNKKAKRLDVYQWDDYVRGLEAFIGWWNANWRGSGKGMNGMTPDEAFTSRAGPMRTVDPETLALALTKPEVRRVRENGVRIANVDYFSDQLFELSGRDVVVHVPLGQTDRVVITDEKGKTICTAVANWFAETRDLKADVEKVRGARKANLEALKRFGVGKVSPTETGKSFIAIAEAEAVPTETTNLLDFPVQNQNYEEPLAMAVGSDQVASRPVIINPLDL